MEQKTIGKFLSALRKANGYTQQQVAEILGVSNKTISKWECDDGYPEITMLSTIAKLYDVSVDEILRGERAERDASESLNSKTEERTKLLLEKTRLRLKNCSAISVPLGVGAVILSYIACDNSSLLTWIGRFLSIIMLTLSIIIAVIGRNNTLPIVKSLNTDEENLKTVKSQINLLFSAELFFGLAVIGATIINIVMEIIIDPWAGLFYSGIFIILSLIISAIVYGVKSKKKKVKPGVEVQRLLQKIVKVTALLIAVTILVTSVSIVVIAYADTHWVNFKYDFTAYPTERDNPEQEYVNFKNHVVNGEPLYYNYRTSYDEENKEYLFIGYKFDDTVVKDDDGYQWESYTFAEDSEEITFKTQAELDDFVDKHTIFVYTQWFYTVKDINFIDEDYTFTWKKDVDDWLSNGYGSLAYLRALQIVSTIICCSAMPVSCIIYNVKKRKIQAEENNE